jgi:hypothetical protein
VSFIVVAGTRLIARPPFDQKAPMTKSSWPTDSETT